MSQFARLQKILNEDNTVKYRKGYVTKAITLEVGDTFYINDIEESLDKLQEFNIISAEEKVAKLAKIREDDAKYNRETTHVLKKAKPQKVVREA